MSEQEKYCGRTPVLTAHIEAMLKASREYSKMMSNDDETPAQRAEIARHFECGAIWEQGYSKQLGWHPASELPPLDENESSDLVYALGKVFSKEFGEYIDKVPCRVRVIHGKWAPEDIEVEWWCYPPKED